MAVNPHCYKPGKYFNHNYQHLFGEMDLGCIFIIMATAKPGLEITDAESTTTGIHLPQ